jgi:hypothetical protein
MTEGVVSVGPLVHGPVLFGNICNKSLMKGFLKIVREGPVDTIGDIWWWTTFVIEACFRSYSVTRRIS